MKTIQDAHQEGVLSNHTYHADCLDLMALIPDGSIDMVLTSPPYDSLREYTGDLIWHEGIWKQVIKELFRVIKDNGVVVWIVGDAVQKGSETGTSFKQALYAMECGFNLHDTMIYAAERPPRKSNRYEQRFEYMFVFSKGRPATINLIHEPCKNAGASRKGFKFRSNGSSQLSDENYSDFVAETKIKGNIWHYQVGGPASDRIAGQHPAVFPEALARDHIISWSNKGETVLDPFAGSGTTGKIARELERNYILAEKSKEYVEVIAKRLMLANTQSFMPFINEGGT